MSPTLLSLDGDPEAALNAIRAASHSHPVVVFKQSPICPTSRWAESEFDTWLNGLGAEAALGVARIDVIGERALARGLTKALGIRHESPQALWFAAGELTWSGSHSELTGDRFRALLALG